MAEIIEVFQARHPGCTVTYVDTGLERDYLDWLRAGDADIIACWLPVSPPEFTVGPLVLRGERVLITAPDHPLAQRESVTYEDLADYPVTDVPALNREMMDALIPPVTPSGVRLRRVARRTFEEALMRVATGEQVHPTVTSFLEHYKGPPIASCRSPTLPRPKRCSYGEPLTAPRRSTHSPAPPPTSSRAPTSRPTSHRAPAPPPRLRRGRAQEQANRSSAEVRGLGALLGVGAGVRARRGAVAAVRAGHAIHGGVPRGAGSPGTRTVALP